MEYSSLSREVACPSTAMPQVRLLILPTTFQLTAALAAPLPLSVQKNTSTPKALLAATAGMAVQGLSKQMSAELSLLDAGNFLQTCRSAQPWQSTPVNRPNCCSLLFLASQDGRSAVADVNPSSNDSHATLQEGNHKTVHSCAI